MREYSIPALAEIPASANAADLVTRRAAEQPSTVMLRRKTAEGTWSDVTAAQFRDEVQALAKGFIAAGVEAGDRIALMSHTRYEWTLIDYALWTAGAVVVPIYETSSAEQAEWILGNSQARAVIAETDGFAALISDARDRLPALEHLWLLDSDLPSLTAAGAGVTAEALDSRARSRSAQDIATIIYTSGTTGRPKGCELTHENLLAAVRNAFLGPLASIHAAGTASTLLFLPLAHVFARVIEVGTLEAGIVLGHCPDMNDLLPDLSSFKPTFVLAVPRVFEKVYNGAEARGGRRGQGQDLRPRREAPPSRTARRLTVRAVSGSGSGRRTPCSTGSSTASSAPRSAARPSGRSLAAPRSRRGSGISSAGSASPSSRGTG